MMEDTAWRHTIVYIYIYIYRHGRHRRHAWNIGDMEDVFTVDDYRRKCTP